VSALDSASDMTAGSVRLRAQPALVTVLMLRLSQHFH